MGEVTIVVPPATENDYQTIEDALNAALAQIPAAAASAVSDAVDESATDGDLYDAEQDAIEDIEAAAATQILNIGATPGSGIYASQEDGDDAELPTDDYFLVQVAGGLEVYRVTGLGTSDLEITVPAATVLEAASAALVGAASLPNKFLPEELEGSDLTGFLVGAGGTLTRISDAGDGYPGFSLTANVSATVTMYRRFAIDAFNGGNISTSVRVLSVEAAPGGSCRHLVIYRDAALSELSRETVSIATSAGLAVETVFSALDKTPPVGTAYIDWYLDVGNGSDPTNQRTMIFRDLTMVEGPTADYRPAAPVTPGAAPVRVYLAASGSDGDDGTFAAPFATISAAVAAVRNAGGYGTITVIEDGDYAGNAITSAGLKKLRIENRAQGRVRFYPAATALGSGFSATGGYAGIYEKTTAAPGAGVTWIYQDEVPDHLTLISDHHALQRGLTHRLPSTRLWPVLSLVALDAATRPSWYHNGTKLYVKCDDGSGGVGADPGSSIFVPSITLNLFATATGVEEIEMDGIECWYYRWPIRLYLWASAKLTNCSGMGGGSNGISADDCPRVEMTLCRTGGNNNDGYGQTGLAGFDLTTTSQGLWSHDNFDDGTSLHAYCFGLFVNSLLEENGDRGDATAVGGHTVYIASTARNNGIFPEGDNNGEGFSATGNSTEGVGTQSECYNCVSYGNVRNYGAGIASSTQPATLFLDNCWSGTPYTGGWHFYATTMGAITARNCMYDGAGTVKAGSVTVLPGTALT